MFWTRRRTAWILGSQFRELFDERGSRFDHGALRRDGGAETAALRARIEVFVGFRRAEFRNAAGDTDLPVEGGPVEHQRGVRIAGEFPALAALVVGEEREASGVDAFQQNHSCGGFAGGGNRGERHRGRFFHAGCARFVEPLPDLPDRIRQVSSLALAAHRVVIDTWGTHPRPYGTVLDAGVI